MSRGTGQLDVFASGNRLRPVTSPTQGKRRRVTSSAWRPAHRRPAPSSSGRADHGLRARRQRMACPQDKSDRGPPVPPDEGTCRLWQTGRPSALLRPCPAAELEFARAEQTDDPWRASLRAAGLFWCAAWAAALQARTWSGSSLRDARGSPALPGQSPSWCSVWAKTLQL